jgi:hypothetical protein
MRAFFRIVVDLLREIGDERPYERYLRARGATHCAAEWPVVLMRPQAARAGRAAAECVLTTPSRSWFLYDH